MTVLIFFSIVFATIIFSIILERLIKCPILIGFAVFSIFLIVAAIFDSVTLVAVAIALGILAYLTAFLYCSLMKSNLFNNGCNNCGCNNTSNNGCNCQCNNISNNDDSLTIVNSNGEIVGRISNNNLTCINECTRNGRCR